MIIGYPFSEEKLWVWGELVLLGFPLDVHAGKCGIFEVRLRFALGELQFLSKLENPTSNKAHSAEGPPNGSRKFPPCLRPFLAGRYAFFENRKGFAKNWQKIADYEPEIWELFLKSPRTPHPTTTTRPENVSRKQAQIEIYTDARAR